MTWSVRPHASDTATMTRGPEVAPTTHTSSHMREADIRESGWQPRHYGLMIGIALVHMLLRAELPLSQDMLWGARFGEQFLDTGRLQHTDTYSWTAHGHTWIPNSWLWNVVLGIVYRYVGVVGFWLLGGVLAALMALTVARVANHIGAPPLPTLAVYIPAGIVGLAAVPRAQTVSTIVLLVIPWLVVRAMTGDRRSAIRAGTILTALQVAWINIHSGALLGPVFVLGCGAAVSIARRRESVRRTEALRLTVITCLATAGCLLTPYWTAPIRHASDVRAASVGLITEWAPIGIGSPQQMVAALAVVAALLLSWRVWRAGRPAITAGILILSAATAGAIRFLPMLAVFAAPEVALVISALKVRVAMFRLIASASAAVLAVFAVSGMRDLRSLGPTVSPRLVSELPGGCRLLNDDLVGDAVTLLRPDVPVSLDSRNDMYGRAIVVTVTDLFQDRPGSDAELARDHVTCILGPSSMALIKRLRGDPGWHVVDHDAVRTLLVRAR